MANSLYALGRKAILDGEIAYLTDNIKAVLTDHGADLPVPATDQFLSDISAGTIDTSVNFTTKTSTDGIADADDLTYTGVTGATVESINIYHDTAVAATSPLIAFIDTATGLPVTPNGGDITVTWDSGANKIFKL